ncbi:hypothetical protein CYMTET_27464 [Cymbomonas tetramitiformis]|uniref:Uncharacterized protein n=1 Tax=Cymbomonas tetramitiformis TaxID=36881 RepID=A0AAE0FRC7_9CHLO|nr:hypothetical protein CYMTET_27464 [Cymbomonas tetramitiformis]
MEIEVSADTQEPSELSEPDETDGLRGIVDNISTDQTVEPRCGEDVTSDKTLGFSDTEDDLESLQLGESQTNLGHAAVRAQGKFARKRKTRLSKYTDIVRARVSTFERIGEEKSFIQNCEHLLRIEGERRTLLKKALITPLTSFSVVSSWRGTVLPHIAGSTLFWFSIVLYWGLRLALHFTEFKAGQDCQLPVSISASFCNNAPLPISQRSPCPSIQCKAGRLNKQNKQLLLEKVVALRASYATLYDLADQPVPFFYAHLIALMTYVYLPLYSYALATDDSAADTSKPHEFMGTLLIMFNGLFFVGLRVIAERMQEPFGAEIEHLSVMHYIVETEKGSRRIIGSMPPDFPSDAQEQELEADREDLGPPYEHMTTSSTRRQRRKSKFPGLMYTINSKDERPLNPPEALRKYKSVR